MGTHTTPGDPEKRDFEDRFEQHMKRVERDEQALLKAREEHQKRMENWRRR